MGCTSSFPEKDIGRGIGKTERCSGPTKGIGQTERLLSKVLEEVLAEQKLEEQQMEAEGGTARLDACSSNETSQPPPTMEFLERAHHSPTNTKLWLGTSDHRIQVEFAYWTQRGYYPDDQYKENQDNFSITTKFAGIDTDAMFAVYDGHGAEGHACSQFCRKELPKIMSRHFKQQRVKRYRDQQMAKVKFNNHNHNNTTTTTTTTTKKLFQPSEWPMLQKNDVEECCRKAFLDCNQSMHDDPKILDKVSGTTGTCLIFHGDLMTISHVGDSRAILGHRVHQHKGGETTTTTPTPTRTKFSLDDNDNEELNPMIAVPLSRDHTPYRQDERDRLRNHGAMILSIDQMNGTSDWDEDEQWDTIVEEEKEQHHLVSTNRRNNYNNRSNDPPRVWKEGKDYPGCSFTRSLGDSVAKEIGVSAEPEMITRDRSTNNNNANTINNITIINNNNNNNNNNNTINYNNTTATNDDEIIVLASDGIFEFISNQEVIDLCSYCDTPLQACERVVREAFDQWLLYENRTDDITIIVCFVKSFKERMPTTTTTTTTTSSTSTSTSTVAAATGSAVPAVPAVPAVLAQEGN